MGYEGTFSVIRWERTLVIFSVIAFYNGGLKGFFAGEEQVFIIKGTKAVPKRKSPVPPRMPNNPKKNMLASPVQNPWIAGITPNKMPGNNKDTR